MKIRIVTRMIPAIIRIKNQIISEQNPINVVLCAEFQF